MAGALVVGTGCGTLETSNDRINPALPLWFHRPQGAMGILFRRELAAASRVEGEPYERGRAEIDWAHGRVFVGTSDHGLYALRADSGSTLWRFETLSSVQSEPLYDPDLDVVDFGSNDGGPMRFTRATDASCGATTRAPRRRAGPCALARCSSSPMRRTNSFAR